MLMYVSGSVPYLPTPVRFCPRFGLPTVKVDLSVAEKLLALATNDGASQEERRTAAMILVTWLAEEKVLQQYRREVYGKRHPQILGWEAECAEFAAVARELNLLYQISGIAGHHRPRRRDVQESLRKRLHLRRQRPMTRAEILAEMGASFAMPADDEYV